MGGPLNILVTGTRNASAKAADNLIYALDSIRESRSFEWIEIYVGDCPTGADLIARNWWLKENPEGYTITSPEPMYELYTSNPVPDDWHGGAEWPWRNHLHIFHADWGSFGYSAGPRRNARMAKAWHEAHGTHAVALWNGATKGSGTLDCMSCVTKLGHWIEVVPCV